MPTYSYKAVNQEGKDVRGTVDAESIEEATAALQSQKMENVVVSEAMRLRKNAGSTKTPESAPSSYAFEGTGTDGVVRRGTIQAESKRHAFDRLRQEQKLTVAMLSPIGVTPQYKDEDLLRWQRDPAASSAAAIPVAMSGANVPVKAVVSTKPQAPALEEVAPEFHDIEKKITTVGRSSTQSLAPIATSSKYYPLVDTIRLYAGWLLAWYLLFVALGYYTFERQMPWDIPIVEGFFFSPLIFRFISGIFLFLALSSLHKLLRGKLLSGVLLVLLGAGLYGVTLIYG